MERVAYILEAEEEDAAVKCEAKSTDRNENAENIAKKKKAGQSEATLAYKIPARTAEQTSEDSENKGCGEKQTLGPVSGMKTAMDGDICFRDVSFGYSPDHPVLKNINFTIPSGSTFAILGTTGSGKSTLVHLLNRLYDLPEDCGSITIGGTDIRDIDRQYLRQNIGMVLQEPFLFSRTIRENIGITKEKLLDEEIRHAAEIACVDESILHFTDGYDTIVGERGVTLSGGQKQRVAIARVLANDPEIILCDEATSALDPMTTESILSLLQTINRTQNITIVVITHEMKVIQQICNRVAVLDEGRIQETGPVSEVFTHPQTKAAKRLVLARMQGADAPCVKLALPEDEKELADLMAYVKAHNLKVLEGEEHV